MLSRWKVALISSAAVAALASLNAAGTCGRAGPGVRDDAAPCSSQGRGAPIASVEWVVLGDDGSGIGERISRNSLLKRGRAYSAGLLAAEMARIDSLMFGAGFPDARAAVDTSSSKDGVDLSVKLDPGRRALIERLTVSGSVDIGAAELGERYGLRSGDPFDPSGLERAMMMMLEDLTSEGYPYAQVWLSGFELDPEDSSVDLNLAIYGGELSSVSSVLFEGLAKTDTSLALRISRIEPGAPYDEEVIRRSRRYLSSSGLFSKVGAPEVLRESAGEVAVSIPVKEMERASSIQGMFGFSRRDGGDYRTSGSIEVGLRNIGGTGRNADFEWIDDGEDFRTTAFDYSEPFVFGLPFELSLHLRQDVYDTLYDFTVLGGGLRYHASPSIDLRAGVKRDSNVPRIEGSFERSTRWRFMLGAGLRSQRAAAEIELEGALRKREFEGAPVENDGQLLYLVDTHVERPVFPGQSLFFRAVSRGAFSSGEIPAAELFALGGARSLRGYRENQFRGEKIGWLTLEYRFGGESRFFIFDDAGFFHRYDTGWKFENGAGFGLRSSSALGTVELSFGVGERLSLDQTRIHIALIESF